MFREISRNKKQILSGEECLDILKKATSGVLCVLGDGDYPYGVPLSYAVSGDKLYFHCALKGHKVDALKKHEKASFTVIETDQIVPEEYTTYFRSVIAFGKVRFVENEEEKRQALMLLAEKYSAAFLDGAPKEIESKLKGVCVLEFGMEHLSGKEAIEFAQAR